MNTRVRRVRPLYSRFYLYGWVVPIALLSLPIVSYPDVGTSSMLFVVAIVILGYVAVRGAENWGRWHLDLGEWPRVTTTFATISVFSLLSIAGSLMVLGAQSGSLADTLANGLQGRYLELNESAKSGDVGSFASTVGNLLRALFFVAIAAAVVYTRNTRSNLLRVAAVVLVFATLALNFLVNVSRLQLVFFVIFAAVTASLVRHPWIRRTAWLIGGGMILVFLFALTTRERLEIAYGDSQDAADAVALFFNINILPLGNRIVEYLGLPFFVLVAYITEVIPELLRLIADNPSPYSLGFHSFFLVISPLARIMGFPLESAPSSITNQGFWWGFMGDLYLDFGIFYPIIYLIALFAMVRIARRFESGGIMGLAFCGMTAAMILIVPYTGIFNTYSVSYCGLLVLAALEHRANRQARLRGRMPAALTETSAE